MLKFTLMHFRFYLVFLLFTLFAQSSSSQDIISTGNIFYTDTIKASNFRLNSGDTLFLSPGVPAVIQACNSIQIDGTVFGRGLGFQNSGPSSNGNGPGGGLWNGSSGASGGGYGGVGGAGGYDSGDPMQLGGTTYGTTIGMDIDMGSGGGNAVIARGGNGGGAIMIIAPSVFINGDILMDGGEAFQPGSGQGGGGGSGGGIKIIGMNVTSTGILSARGGDGSIGTSVANDDGGGGGGGRVKIFYEINFSNLGFIDVSPGLGGIYGSASGPTDGEIGTVHMYVSKMEMLPECVVAPIPDLGFWAIMILILSMSIIAIVHGSLVKSRQSSF